MVSIAKRYLKANTGFFELVSDGNISLIRAVEKFDYARGFKFSTYASWAILKNFARSVPAEQQRQDRFRTGNDEVFAESSEQKGSFFIDEHMNLTQRAVIQEMMQELDGREQKVIACRFGLSAGEQPETLEQVGNRLGSPKNASARLKFALWKNSAGSQNAGRLKFPGSNAVLCVQRSEALKGSDRRTLLRAGLLECFIVGGQRRS